MSEQLEREIHRNNNVIIGKCSASDTSYCDIKRCKRHDKYTVFIGDATRLSTVFAGCCQKHLPLMIDKAYKQREKDIAKQIKRMKQREIEQAEKVLSNNHPVS